MELNFNSVEMSREPRAEASSLDYAEAKLKIVGNLLQDGQIVSHVIQKCVFIGLWVNFQPAN